MEIEILYTIVILMIFALLYQKLKQPSKGCGCDEELKEEITNK